MAKLEGEYREEPRERFADQEEKEDSESVPLDRNLSEILRSFANRMKEEENNITAVLLKTESGWDNLSNPTPPTTPTLAPTPSAPTDGNDQLTHLLRESILGSEFVVSPGSFVQTNFAQAEKIYSRVVDSVEATK
jgi:tRNA/tmRNA/rRNA uracil-C5-methylase (TrmA/RlmC/RlmD family)